MKKHIANIITASRIAFSLILLLFPVFSPEFCICYILCGLSDMIDGTIARLTGSSGEFGAKLDSAADFLFTAAALVKLLPEIILPKWLLIWAVIIAAVKFSNVLRGWVQTKQFISVHTVLNKATGLILFLLPLTSSFLPLQYTTPVICVIATAAAVQERFYIRTGRHIP